MPIQFSAEYNFNVYPTWKVNLFQTEMAPCVFAYGLNTPLGEKIPVVSSTIIELCCVIAAETKPGQ